MHCPPDQIKYALRYRKGYKAVIEDLKPVYKAVNEEMGYENLLVLEKNWGKKYPIAAKSWLENWTNLSTFSSMMNRYVRLFILLILLKECTVRSVKLQNRAQRAHEYL